MNILHAIRGLFGMRQKAPSALSLFLTGPEANPMDEATQAAVHDALVLFYRGGGTVTDATWSTWPAQVRGLAAAARQLVERERAVLHGLAAAGDCGRAEVSEPMDGGMGLERIGNESLLERMTSGGAN